MQQPVMPDRKQVIKHCSVHTIISAAPSFVMAYLLGWNHLLQIAGMLAGILLFLLCAVWLHIYGPVARVMRSPSGAWALHWTKRVRLVQVALMIPAWIGLGAPRGMGPLQTIASIILSSDFWAGGLANSITDSMGLEGALRHSPVLRQESWGGLFIQPLAATFIEGWILAAGLAVICLALWGAAVLFKKMKPWFAALLMPAAVAAILLSPSKSFSEEAPPMQVGAVLHLTGDLAMQSAAFREGIELALDEANASDSKTKINLVLEDGRNSPKASNSAVQKLLTHNTVDALILSSYLDAMASGSLLEKRRIPSIVLWDSSPEIEELGEYTFAIGPWTPSAGEEAARFAVQKLGATTAAVVLNSDSWSEAVGKFFKEEFSRLGGQVIEEILLEASETDFRTPISRIKAKGPSIIYSPLVFNLVPFYSQIKQQKLSATIISSDIIADEHISKAPEAFEGIYQTGLVDPKSEPFERLLHAYKKKFGHDMTLPWFVAVGYDSVKLLLLARATRGMSAEQIKNGLYDIRDFQGASGTISFNDKGSSPQLERMYRIKQGKLVLEP